MTLVLAALSLVRFGPHLLWRLNLAWDLSRDELPVSAIPMPEVAIPEDYVRCQFGSVSLHVPAALVPKPEFKGGVGAVVLRDGSREVLLFLPNDNRAVMAALRRDVADRGGMTTYTRLRLEAHQAKRSDFHWRMSRPELERHKWLVQNWILLAPWSTSVESRLGGDTEGLLFSWMTGATFEWTGDNDNAFGNIIFDQRPGPLDWEWVRPICASLKYTGGVFDRNLTEEELPKLFRIEKPDK
jgi:hypothetical protein